MRISLLCTGVGVGSQPPGPPCLLQAAMCTLTRVGIRVVKSNDIQAIHTVQHLSMGLERCACVNTFSVCGSTTSNAVAVRCHTGAPARRCASAQHTCFSASVHRALVDVQKPSTVESMGHCLQLAALHMVSLACCVLIPEAGTSRVLLISSYESIHAWETPLHTLALSHVFVQVLMHREVCSASIRLHT